MVANLNLEMIPRQRQKEIQGKGLTSYSETTHSSTGQESYHIPTLVLRVDRRKPRSLGSLLLTPPSGGQEL